MVYFLFLVLVGVICLFVGARYHAQVNSRFARIFGKGEELPADFQIWLNNHKGEFDSIGKAMNAWADAKYGDKHDNILK